MAKAKLALNGHELCIEGEALDIAERVNDRRDKASQPWVVLPLVDGGDVLVWADTVSHIYFLDDSRRSY
jgi:hypothetical protein